MRELCPAFKMW